MRQSALFCDAAGFIGALLVKRGAEENHVKMGLLFFFGVYLFKVQADDPDRSDHRRLAVSGRPRQRMRLGKAIQKMNQISPFP